MTGLLWEGGGGEDGKREDLRHEGTVLVRNVVAGVTLDIRTVNSKIQHGYGGIRGGKGERVRQHWGGGGVVTLDKGTVRVLESGSPA